MVSEHIFKKKTWPNLYLQQIHAWPNLYHPSLHPNFLSLHLLSFLAQITSFGENKSFPQLKEIDLLISSLLLSLFHHLSYLTHKHLKHLNLIRYMPHGYNKTKCCIQSSMETEILTNVIDATTSSELWSKVEAQFEAESVAKKIRLKMKLMNEKKGNSSIAVYFTKLKSIVHELALAGEVISEVDVLTYLIGGLNRSFDAPVVYIEANINRMSLSEAYSMLLAHESRIEKDVKESHVEAKMELSANVAQSNSSFNQNKGIRPWNNGDQFRSNGRFRDGYKYRN